jgi:hypothetical protein
MGSSGTGKSTSLRNLNPKETFIIRPNAKSFPFPGGDVNFNKENKNLLITNELDELFAYFKLVSDKKPHVKYIILEDFTHFFAARIFSPNFLSRSTGGEAFQRWNEFGASVYQALFEKAQELRDDLYIVVLHHTEVKEDGTIGFRSAGKLLDNTIDFPSYFNYIFHGFTITENDVISYKMLTNLHGGRDAKTPYGLFPDIIIPNNLAPILKRIDDFRKGKIKIEFKE